jgi:F0F1-type ATP synthase membrane subunit c/vacuolar-type H+-ATPase subunit K
VPTARSPRPARRRGLVDHNAIDRRKMARRTRLYLAGAIVLVGLALFAVAGGQALVAAHQVALDQAQQSLSSAVARDQNLEFSLSKLESPARIVEIAEGRYGMVVAQSVVYLAPVDPGPTVIAAARKTSR